MNKIVLLVAAGIWVLTSGCATTPTPEKPLKQTWSSFDQPSEHAPEMLAPGTVNFEGVSAAQVLKIYAALSGRTVIGGTLPNASITFHNQTPLSRVEMLQQFDTVLAQNGIAMVLSGDKAVKAMPAERAVMESPPEITLPWSQLPDSSSCMTRTVHLQHFKPTEVVPVLQPFSKLPNSIIAIDGDQILILRDYSANIRQQLRLLEELEKKQSR